MRSWLIHKIQGKPCYQLRTEELFNMLLLLIDQTLMAYTIVNVVPSLEDESIPQLRLNQTTTLNLNHLNLKTKLPFTFVNYL